jgi:hypothetical protein
MPCSMVAVELPTCIFDAHSSSAFGSILPLFLSFPVPILPYFPTTTAEPGTRPTAPGPRQAAMTLVFYDRRRSAASSSHREARGEAEDVLEGAW